VVILVELLNITKTKNKRFFQVDGIKGYITFIRNSDKSYCMLETKTIYADYFESRDFYHELKHIKQNENGLLNKLQDIQLFMEQSLFIFLPFLLITQGYNSFIILGFIYILFYMFPTFLIELDAYIYGFKHGKKWVES
jgi:hypothetical protein